MLNLIGLATIILLSVHGVGGEGINCDPGYYYNSEAKMCDPCPRNTYKPGENQGPCITCPPDSEGNQARTIDIASTSVEDCFFRPSIKSFSPTYGPVSGGTEVSILVYHVQNREIVVLRFNHREAEPNPHIGNQGDNFLTEIVCFSPAAKNHTPGAGPIHMQFVDDENEYSFDSDEDFVYLPDPIIFNVDKLKTIASGGTELEVHGTFFTSVANPFLIVTRIYYGVHKRFLTPCRVQNGNFMTCITPDLTEGLNISDFRVGRSGLDDVEDNIPDPTSRRRRRDVPDMPDIGGAYDIFNYSQPINNDHLKFFAGFKLDGVPGYENYTELPVYWDPNFHQFEAPRNVRVFNPDVHPFLDIKGERLNYGLTVRDLFVSIGIGDCPVTYLATNLLTCRPPYLQPLPAPDAAGPDNTPMVVVRAGAHLSFSIGFLRWVNTTAAPAPPQSSPPPRNILTLVVVVVGVFWLLLLAGCSAWCVYSRYQQRKRFRYKYRTPTPDPQHYVTSGSDGSSGFTSGAGVIRHPGEEERLDNGYLRPILQETSLTNLPNDSHYLNGGLLQNGAPNGGLRSGRRMTSSSDVTSGNESILAGLDEASREKVKVCCLDNRRLTLGSVIGSGNYGKVYKAVLADQNFQNGQEVAVKTLIDSRVTAERVKEFLEEALIMSGFSHDHVLTLHGVVIRGLKPHVVLEYMDRGDLRSYVANLERTMTVGELLSLSHQVAAGMTYLSGRGFVHRDLAARNCMINSEMQVKIADFGLSRDIHQKEYYTSRSQGRPLPVKWMSIESLNHGKFSTKSDIWSFGVLMWEVLMRGVTPYPDVDNFDIRDYLNAGHRLDQPSHVPNNVYRVMKTCWAESAADRPGFSEIHATLGEMLSQGGDIYSREYLPVFDNISLSASEDSLPVTVQPTGTGGTGNTGDSGQGDDEADDVIDDVKDVSDVINDDANPRKSSPDGRDYNEDDNVVVVDVHVDSLDENLNEITVSSVSRAKSDSGSSCIDSKVAPGTIHSIPLQGENS